jgi:hypothetical protein
MQVSRKGAKAQSSPRSLLGMSSLMPEETAVRHTFGRSHFGCGQGPRWVETVFFYQTLSG